MHCWMLPLVVHIFGTIFLKKKDMKKMFLLYNKGGRFITISTKNAICDTNSRLDSSSFASMY